MIPVVDLSAGTRDAAGAIRAAARDTGFFYAVNHGVPAGTVAAQLEAARRFFSLPLAAKQRVGWEKSSARRGYEAIAAQVLDDGSPPDLKESFYLGTDVHGANQWPELAGFRAPTEAYFTALCALTGRVMALLALSLELPQDYFDAMHRRPMQIMRLIHYPPHPPNPAPNQLGAGAHTDWGTLTFLAQDDVGGLEVRNAAGEWLRAAPLAGSFVVNLGDMIARWTNGLYHSNLHRVLNAGGRDRYSVAFFANPDPDARIECLPTCTDAAHPPQFEPCTAGEHIEQMYRKTTARPAA